MSEELCSVFCYKMWIVQRVKPFVMVDVSGISWISTVLEMLSVSRIDDQKIFLICFCNVSLFWFLLNSKFHFTYSWKNLRCVGNFHDKLAQDFMVPWELDSLGMKLSFSTSSGTWLPLQRIVGLSVSRVRALLGLYCCMWKLGFLNWIVGN